MGPFKRRKRERAARKSSGVRPGRAYEARHWHEAECRWPRGGPCTCPDGPDVELVPLVDPVTN